MKNTENVTGLRRVEKIKDLRNESYTWKEVGKAIGISPTACCSFYNDHKYLLDHFFHLNITIHRIWDYNVIMLKQMRKFKIRRHTVGNRKNYFGAGDNCSPAVVHIPTMRTLNWLIPSALTTLR